jgi:ankyrin repeat protein
VDIVGRFDRWFRSVIEGDIETVKRHLREGIDVEARTNRSRTPLMLAAMYGHTAVVDALIKAGADVDAVLDEGVVFDEPAWFDESIDDDDLSPFDTATALNHAVMFGRVDAARLLIKAGADLEAPAWDLTPPLALAASRGNAVLVDLLVEAGAAVDDGFDYTPLEAATRGGNAKITRRLITAGADVNQKGEDGVTPLMRAAAGGHLGVVELLVESGADPRAWEQGETPLLCAAKGGHQGVFDYLEPLVTDEIRAFVAETADQ